MENIQMNTEMIAMIGASCTSANVADDTSAMNAVNAVAMINAMTSEITMNIVT
jgi:hypothetical protein